MLQNEISEMRKELAAATAQKDNMQVKAVDSLTKLKTVEEQLESKALQLDEVETQMSVWRARARHRGRSKAAPNFEKLPKAKRAAAKAKWLKKTEIDDALGYDAVSPCAGVSRLLCVPVHTQYSPLLLAVFLLQATDKPVTVTFKNPGPIGIGWLKFDDPKDSKMKYTVVHSIKEGSPADLSPFVVSAHAQLLPFPPAP